MLFQNIYETTRTTGTYCSEASICWMTILNFFDIDLFVCFLKKSSCYCTYRTSLFSSAMAYHPSLWHQHPSTATLASGKLQPSELLLHLQLPQNQNRPVARLRNLLLANPLLLKFQRQSKIWCRLWRRLWFTLYASTAKYTRGLVTLPTNNILNMTSVLYL